MQQKECATILKLCENSTIYSQYLLGSKENELEMLEIASNMMEPAAMFLLGTYLYNGEFMEKDTVRAVSLFYESAKKGNARAMYEYSLYMSRNGVEKDFVLGFVRGRNM